MSSRWSSLLQLIMYEVSHYDFYHIDGDLQQVPRALDPLGLTHPYITLFHIGIGSVDGGHWFGGLTSPWLDYCAC